MRLLDRWPVLVGGACGLTLLSGLLWVIVTGLVARAQLQDVQRDLRQVRTALARGDVTEAQRIAGRMVDQAGSAHALTCGPAWWVSANLPVLGDPAFTTRVITAQTDLLARRVVPRVLGLARAVTAAGRTHDGGVDLAPLVSARAALVNATASALRATNTIRSAPASWFGPVSGGRRAALVALGKVDDRLRAARDGVTLALPMLGEDGPRRYFIGFLNEAEARGVGGIPGAFAIATVDHGRLRFEHFGSDTELQHVRAHVDFGAQYIARYAQDDPAGTIQNSDISPDFRYAAQIWAGMWRAKTGERIDGAIAIDPTALSYLLRAAGDVGTPTGTRVGAANVVALTQQRQYALYPGLTTTATAERKRYLIGVARTAADTLTGGGHLHALVGALSRAADERRLVLWSAVPAEERSVIAGGYAGALTVGTGAFTGFGVVNGAGSKLDFYLHRTMTYRRTGCGADSATTATLTLANTAPRSGLPQYVTYRADKPAGRIRPGDNLDLVTYYGTPGSRVDSVTLDGARVPAAVGAENDLTAVTISVPLAAGQRRTVRIELREPAVHGAPEVLRQPGVAPLITRIDARKCA